MVNETFEVTSPVAATSCALSETLTESGFNELPGTHVKLQYVILTRLLVSRAEPDDTYASSVPIPLQENEAEFPSWSTYAIDASFGFGHTEIESALRSCRSIIPIEFPKFSLTLISDSLFLDPPIVRITARVTIIPNIAKMETTTSISSKLIPFS